MVNLKKVTPNTILEVWEAKRIWCKPIPLTEEILLKCGFENLLDKKDENLCLLSKGRFIVEKGFISKIFDDEFSFRIKTDKYHSTHCNSIKNLHELQNLYCCLVGEELEVNL